MTVTPTVTVTPMPTVTVTRDTDRNGDGDGEADRNGDGEADRDGGSITGGGSDTPLIAVCAAAAVAGPGAPCSRSGGGTAPPDRGVPGPEPAP